MELKAGLKSVYERAGVVRFAPYVLACSRSDQRAAIEADVSRWMTVKHLDFDVTHGLVHLLTWHPEFRSQVMFRLGVAGRALRLAAPGMPTLFFNTDRRRVGPGLVVQHGFATIIAARSIGANCWINQQVTIGYTDDDRCPTIEDDVTIGAGAIVIGDVTLARGTTVAAGAVVVKDTPPHSVVAGVPAVPVRSRSEV